MKCDASSTVTYSLRWDAEGAEGSAADATWGRLAILSQGVPLWGSSSGGVVEGIHWTWVELLEWLALAWPWLEWEHGWPFDVDAVRPAQLESSVQNAVDILPAKQAGKLEDDFFEFKHRHDLATALQGAFVPALWVIRDGATVWVSSPSREVWLPLSQAIEALSSLGDSRRLVTRLRRALPIFPMIGQGRRATIGSPARVAPRFLGELLGGDRSCSGSSDRKFVAVSRKHPKRPSIVYSIERGWDAHAGVLAEHGATLECLCPTNGRRRPPARRQRPPR